VPLFTICSFCIGLKSDRNSRDLEKSKGATGFNVPAKELRLKKTTPNLFLMTLLF